MEATDHDLLVRLDEKMDVVLKRLDAGDEELDDHDKRLKKLEVFQAKLIGIALAASAGISAIIVWVQNWFGSGS